MRAANSLLCFDLDGTLVDSAPDLCLALGAALNAVGFASPTEQQTRGWIGDGVENLLRRALTHAGADEAEHFRMALDAFHTCYTENLFNRSELYPDVESVLSTLREGGHRLCCITNKRVEYAQTLLERAGIHERFDFVFGGNSFAEKKPHPRQLIEAARRAGASAAECIMIGDSDTDSRAAAAAGFRFVWASYGYSEALQSRQPAQSDRIASFTELLAAISPLQR